MDLNSYPTRRYIPWLRWLSMLPTVPLLAIGTHTSVNIGVKLIVVLIVLALWITFYPIKQKFVFNDNGVELSFFARANILGQITLIFDIDGEMKSEKLGRLSRTSQYLHLDVLTHGVLRKYTLIHLGNSRYFFLSGQDQGASSSLRLVSNEFCF